MELGKVSSTVVSNAITKTPTKRVKKKTISTDAAKAKTPESTKTAGIVLKYFVVGNIHH